MSSYFVRKKGHHLTIYRQEFVAGKRKQFYVPKTLWQSLGVTSENEADIKAAVSRLNKDGSLKRQAERQASALQAVNKKAIVESVFLPEDLATAFIEDFKEKSFGSDAHVSKLEQHWQTIQTFIAEWQIDPKDYADKSAMIYRSFAKRRYSPNYVNALLRVLNAWGRFVSKRLGSFYDDVPAPKAAALTLIKKEYQKSEYNRDGGSAPLTPAMLETLRGRLPADQFDWLSLSVYFGLRPIEVETLKNPKYYKIEFDKHEVPVLHLDQSKLRHSEGQTWKAIPCVLPEQVDLLLVIQGGVFRRPLAKTLQSYTGDERLTLYGGRKGFVELMQNHGQDMQDISLWLGHATVDRTWKSYANKSRVSWKPVKKA